MYTHLGLCVEDEDISEGVGKRDLTRRGLFSVSVFVNLIFLQRKKLMVLVISNMNSLY